MRVIGTSFRIFPCGGWRKCRRLRTRDSMPWWACTPSNSREGSSLHQQYSHYRIHIQVCRQPPLLTQSKQLSSATSKNTLKPDNATKESKRKRRKAKGRIVVEDGLLPQDFTAMTRCPARMVTSRLLLATILTRRQRTPNLGRLGTASATTARRRMMSPRGRIKRRFSLEAVGRHSSLGIHGSC
jgi:hypothetical protein